MKMLELLKEISSYRWTETRCEIDDCPETEIEFNYAGHFSSSELMTKKRQHIREFHSDLFKNKESGQ